MKLGKYKLLATLFLQERFCYDNLGSASRHSEFISESTFGHSRESGNLGSWIPGQARNDAWRILKEMLGPGFSNTVSRLLSDKLITRSRLPESALRAHSDSGSQVSFQITYLGVNGLLSRFPLLDYFHLSHRHAEDESIRSISGRDSSGSLDPQNDDEARFTLVVFNVPEEKRKLRDRLRYVLKTLSFGQINRSLYISPHLSVKEARNLTDSPYVHIFSIPLAGFGRGEEARELLAGFWDLKETERLYERALAGWETAFIQKTQPNQSVSPPAGESGNQKIRPSDSSDDLSVPSILKASVGGRFLSLFLEALINDPFLPPSLLPKDWPGSKALEIAKRILT